MEAKPFLHTLNLLATRNMTLTLQPLIPTHFYWEYNTVLAAVQVVFVPPPLLYLLHYTRLKYYTHSIPSHLLFSVKTLVLSDIVARNVSLPPRVLGAGKPPVSLVSGDDVHQVSLLEAEVVIRTTVVIVFPHKHGVLGGRGDFSTHTCTYTQYNHSVLQGDNCIRPTNKPRV